jgi:hypothetical protein
MSTTALTSSSPLSASTFSIWATSVFLRASETCTLSSTSSSRQSFNKTFLPACALLGHDDLLGRLKVALEGGKLDAVLLLGEGLLCALLVLARGVRRQGLHSLGEGRTDLARALDEVADGELEVPFLRELRLARIGGCSDAGLLRVLIVRLVPALVLSVVAAAAASALLRGTRGLEA